MSGFEYTVPSGTQNAADLVVSNSVGTTSWQTATVRTGSQALKFPGSATLSYQCTMNNFTAALATTYYQRGYYNFAGTTGKPSVDTALMVYQTSPGNVKQVEVRYTTSGTLILWNSIAGAQVGSASAVMSTGTWHKVELSLQINSTANTGQAALQVDGVSIASSTTLGTTTTSGLMTPIVLNSQETGAPSTSLDVYLDDWALNDSTGTANNSWCGDGNIVALNPVSDNAIGTWTAGAGGTTSLFDAINNIPPTGVAAASETNLTQIKNANGTASQNYDVNMATYSTAISAGATIVAVQAGLWHAEEVATGTKAGTANLQSNPSGSTVSFNYGNDAGAAGTWPTTWAFNFTPAVDAPSVTLTSSPVVRVTKVTATTRVTDVCAVSLYVDYTPAPTLPPSFQIVKQAVNRSATY